MGNIKMSYIAAALAKSKGRNVTPPPAEGIPDALDHVILPNPLLQPLQAETHAPDRTPNLKLYALIGAVVVAGALLVFFKWHSADKASATPAAQATAIPSPTSKSPPPLTPQSAPTTATGGSIPTEPASTIQTSAEETLTIVHQFSVTAVISGPNGVARIDGKTYHVGDTVRPGLDLIEIRDGQLFFRDSSGTVFLHRF